QNWKSVLAGVRPAQEKPNVLRDIFLGDGGEYGDARLRSQQVVTGRCVLSRFDLEAERQQLAPRIEQEAEVHVIREFPGSARNLFKIFDQSQCPRARLRQHVLQALI